MSIEIWGQLSCLNDFRLHTKTICIGVWSEEELRWDAEGMEDYIFVTRSSDA
jgi:hypothetical protein